MRSFSVVAAAAAFVGLAQAQSECLSTALNVPLCGLSILTQYGSSFGCQFTDFACQCSYSASIQQLALTPILEACGATTGLAVQSSADALCSCVKYSGNVPGTAAVTHSTSGKNNYGNQLCVSYGLAIPTCGTSALQSIASSIGGCDGVDFECQCGLFSKVQALASTPIISACGTTTALLVEEAADQLCSCITANNAPPPGATANATAAVTSHAGAVHAVGGQAVTLIGTALSFVPVGSMLGALMGVVAWL